MADLTLRLGDLGLHEVLWSEDLLSEVERVLVTDKGLTAAQARYFGDCIRRSFPAGEIKRDVYEDLILTRSGRPSPLRSRRRRKCDRSCSRPTVAASQRATLAAFAGARLTATSSSHSSYIPTR